LQSVALELFERHGFGGTTVAEIAAAAGVTEMTFFRHFATKAGVVLEDPYDTAIARAVSKQPVEVGPLSRATAGLRDAWRQVPEPDGDVVRRRVRIVAITPSLRGEVGRLNAVTEALIVEQLITDGTDPLPAKVAAAATIAALTAALFEWSLRENSQLGDVIESALKVLEGGRG
jgi:AcrR family transcriptional regulator